MAKLQIAQDPVADELLSNDPFALGVAYVVAVCANQLLR